MSKLRCILIFTGPCFFLLGNVCPVFSEKPEIVDGAISCGQNEAVEGEALHVIGLGGSFKSKQRICSLKVQ